MLSRFDRSLHDLKVNLICLVVQKPQDIIDYSLAIFRGQLQDFEVLLIGLLWAIPAAQQVIGDSELAGMANKYKEHRKKPLTKHLHDFKVSPLAKGNTKEYVEQTLVRIKPIFADCRFVYWKDISASVLQKHLASLRTKENGIGAQTLNYYLQSIKKIYRWMVQNQRASESPLEHLKGVNVRTDRRHNSRALEPDEMRRLLEATAAAPKRFGMSGYERYPIYRFAAETGLRANEIRNLTVGDFDILRVTAKASYSKRRREDVQPLRPDTAVLLKDFSKVRCRT